MAQELDRMKKIITILIFCLSKKKIIDTQRKRVTASVVRTTEEKTPPGKFLPTFLERVSFSQATTERL